MGRESKGWGGRGEGREGLSVKSEEEKEGRRERVHWYKGGEGGEKGAGSLVKRRREGGEKGRGFIGKKEEKEGRRGYFGKE